jgi:NAD(P)H-dependent FMN reductase
MIEIAGIAGSLRKGSHNRALLRAAAELMPDGTVMNVLSIDEVPLYHGDVEATSGIPAAVAALKSGIERARGLVIATPEYNGGIPGVLKNAIDWASRPASDIPRVFYGKPVALMGATPGGGGTILSQTGWLQILRNLRVRLWTAQGPLYVSGAAKVFDASGLIDAELRERVRKYMAAFVEEARGEAG